VPSLTGVDEMSDIQLDGTTDVPSLVGELKRLFQANRWGFSEAQDAPVLLSEFAGPLGAWPLCAQAIEETRLVVFHSICPRKAPPSRRQAMADLLTRANYGLSLASFEMDFEDGEIRCKTVLPVQGALDGRVVERLITANGRTMETFLPAITAVADGSSVRDVIRRIAPAW
jgi:hypothetical protein